MRYKRKKGQTMSPQTKQSVSELQIKLDRITTKAQKLTANHGYIQLNPNNPQHKEWYEDDNHKN